ncbi:MAG: hypothetical protein Q9222_001826 [Ikaeria aurantiellina]
MSSPDISAASIRRMNKPDVQEVAINQRTHIERQEETIKRQKSRIQILNKELKEERNRPSNEQVTTPDNSEQQPSVTATIIRERNTATRIVLWGLDACRNFYNR